MMVFVCRSPLLLVGLVPWFCLSAEAAGGLRAGGRLAAGVRRGRQGRFHELQAGLAPGEPLYTARIEMEACPCVYMAAYFDHDIGPLVNFWN